MSDNLFGVCRFRALTVNDVSLRYSTYDKFLEIDQSAIVDN